MQPPARSRSVTAARPWPAANSLAVRGRMPAAWRASRSGPSRWAACASDTGAVRIWARPPAAVWRLRSGLTRPGWPQMWLSPRSGPRRGAGGGARLARLPDLAGVVADREPVAQHRRDSGHRLAKAAGQAVAGGVAGPQNGADYPPCACRPWPTGTGDRGDIPSAVAFDDQDEVGFGELAGPHRVADHQRDHADLFADLRGSLGVGHAPRHRGDRGGGQDRPSRHPGRQPGHAPGVHPRPGLPGHNGSAPLPVPALSPPVVASRCTPSRRVSSEQVGRRW